jgi:hypothetical protein
MERRTGGVTPAAREMVLVVGLEPTRPVKAAGF